MNKPLDSLIFTLRDKKLILDADLAELYGVPTKALNQAIKRNAERFPLDFMFQLTSSEWANLKSQFVTSSSEVAGDAPDTPNRPQIAAGSLRSQIVTLKTGRGQHPKYSPYAFTEHGALMAAQAHVIWGAHSSRVPAEASRLSELLNRLQFHGCWKIRAKKFVSAGRRNQHARRMCSPELTGSPPPRSSLQFRNSGLKK